MKQELIEKMNTLITSAFGLVAALAWNSTVQAIFNKYYQKGEGIESQVIYAVAVTVIAVLVTVWAGNAMKKAKEREERRSKRNLEKAREKKKATRKSTA